MSRSPILARVPSARLFLAAFVLHAACTDGADRDVVVPGSQAEQQGDGTAGIADADALGSPPGLRDDLLRICREAEKLPEGDSAEEAGEKLLELLREQNPSSWHTSTARELIASAAGVENNERVALVQAAAAEAGVEFSPESCGHLFWAWGGKPLLEIRIEGLCSLAGEMARTGAFEREISAETGPLMDRLALQNTIAKNWNELTIRFGQEHSLPRARLREIVLALGFQDAIGLHPGEVVLGLERAAARALGRQDFSCPAFSYLYLPEWAGAADGPGRDLFWICYAGRDLEHIDADFAGRVLLDRLTNDPPTEWRTPQAGQLVRAASSLERGERYRPIAELARASGVEIPSDWCAGTAMAWGTHPSPTDGGQEYAKMLQDVPAERFPRQEMVISDTGSRSRMELVSLTVSPEVGRPAVERELRRRAGDLRFCVERFSPEGETMPISLTTPLTLAADGSVSEIGRINVAGGTDAIASCAATRLGLWRISDADGVETVVATWRYEVDRRHADDVNEPATNP